MSYTSEFVESNGIRLHYLHWASDGPPVVIVHGNTHCGGVYAPLAEKLAPEFSVYAMDLRGHGLSDKADSYSWACCATTSSASSTALDLRDVLFVAHSRGGGACISHRRRRGPNACGASSAMSPTSRCSSGMTKASTNASPTSSRGRRGGARPGPTVRRCSTTSKAAAPSRTGRTSTCSAFVEHGAIDLPDGAIGLASPTYVEGLMYREIFNIEEWKKIETCPVPVLAIFGEDGGRMKPGEDPVGELRKLFLRVDLKVQPKSTHSGPMEQPELFEASIREFAASL